MLITVAHLDSLMATPEPCLLELVPLAISPRVGVRHDSFLTSRLGRKLQKLASMIAAHIQSALHEAYIYKFNQQMETLPKIVVHTEHIETPLWVILSKQHINYLHDT